MIRKTITFMDTMEPQRRLGLSFNGDRNDFKRDVDNLNTYIDIEIKRSKEALSDGRSNVNNHDYFVISTQPIGGYNSKIKMKMKKNIVKADRQLPSPSIEYFDINEANKTLDENRTVICKRISYNKSYDGSEYLYVDGFYLLDKKSILERIIKTSLAQYIRDGLKEKELRENSYKYGMSRLMQNISCKHIELYLAEKYDSQTLLQLILNECDL